MANHLDGSVTKIGATGSLICDIANEHLAEVPRDENTIVKFGEHETRGLFEVEHDHPTATMVAYLGKSGSLEIEIVGISLSEMLGIRPGEKISVHW